eukprot:2252150-Prymnesium_polylepis.1
MDAKIDASADKCIGVINTIRGQTAAGAGASARQWIAIRYRAAWAAGRYLAGARIAARARPRWR